MTRILSLALGIFICASTRAGDDAAKGELGKLQGTWTATKVTFNGKDYLTGKSGFQFEIKKDEAVVRGSGEVQREYARLRLKLETGTMPKLLDITVTLGVQKDATMEGIYELKDDEFKFAVKVFGVDRPTEFAAPEGSSVALVVLKRDKGP